MKQLRVAVDTKNLALFSGGISAFLRPLLRAWIAERPAFEFVLAGPQFEAASLAGLDNWRLHRIPWPEHLPRPLRHPFYDNLLFSRAMRRIEPDFIFSPYHDVRLPRGVPSAMMIHDTCIGDLPGVYPQRVRAYYGHMLKVNLARARHVLTVSESSRSSVMARCGLEAHRVSVVPNTLEPDFLCGTDDAARLASLQASQRGTLRLLYTGGGEFRKNVRRLMQAVESLVASGTEAQLWTTGTRDAGWSSALAGLPQALQTRLHFVGRVSFADLRAHYLAADAVVYPSLCEGFGRACLEAMELGVPIACSDLPVLREVADDYPVYFDPFDVDAMAKAILTAASRGRQTPYHDPRFERGAVTQRFIETMDAIIAREVRDA